MTAGSDGAIPTSGSDGASPTSGSDDAIPTAGSDDAIPTSGSDDAIPTSGSDDATSPSGTASGPALRVGVASWLLVVEGLLVLTTLPGLIPLMLLGRDADAIPLVALTLLPVGPALAAAVFAWRRFDAGDPTPAPAFWRGYRLNVLDSVRVWVPTLLALAVLASTLTHLAGLTMPVLLAVLGAVVGALVVPWSAGALVIASLFSFRMRDTARISAYLVVALPLVSLGAIVLAALAGGLLVVAPVWVLALLASPFSYLLARNARPLAAEVERRFVVGAPDAVVGKPWPGLDAPDDDPTD